ERHDAVAHDAERRPTEQPNQNEAVAVQDADSLKARPDLAREPAHHADRLEIRNRDRRERRNRILDQIGNPLREDPDAEHAKGASRGVAVQQRHDVDGRRYSRISRRVTTGPSGPRRGIAHDHRRIDWRATPGWSST